MRKHDRLDATIESAKLLSPRFERVLRDRVAPSARFEGAISPLYGIRRISPFVKSIGSRELNRILALGRNSALPLKICNSTASLLGDALAGDFEFPPCCLPGDLWMCAFLIDLGFSLQLPPPRDSLGGPSGKEWAF